MSSRTKRVGGALVAVVAFAALSSGVANARDDGDRRDDKIRCTQTADASKGDDRDDRRSLKVAGLTGDNRLVCFSERRPEAARSVGTVTGLVTDAYLVGIDYRPANGLLYGLGNSGGIYTIDASNAAATFVARLNVALSGTAFGVDFNPTVDRLRVVSDNGQNLRVVPDTGVTTTDVALNYTAGTPAPGIVGAGYTNNDADANTGTTLFDIDSSLDQLAIQAPPNNGSLNVVGKLGVDTGTAVGFDIYSVVRNGTTTDVKALASLTVGGAPGFYEVSLLQGKVTARGTFPVNVVDIAIPLNQL